MKKVLPVLVILFILALFIQMFTVFFITSHSVKYSIKKDKEFEISEKLTNKVNYDFIVKSEDVTYNFFYKHNFNKQERVIKDIKVYSEDKLYCIVPVFKRGLFDNIYCSDGKDAYSYSYLKNSNNSSFNNIVKKIEEDGYYKDSYNESNDIKKEFNNNYFIGNVPDNYKIIMWNYTGLDIFDNKELDRKQLFDDRDLYDNDYSTLVGRYYVVLEKNSTSEILFYNIEKYGKGTIPCDDTLSGEYNILGVYKNKLYLVDLDNYVEYTIDPYIEKVEKIGDSETGYKGFSKNKLIDVSTSDFKSNIDSYKLIKKIDDASITSKYGECSIYEVGNYYYYKTANNTFYRANKKYKNAGVALFKVDNISDWKIVNKNILVISDNILYLYNDDYGLKKLILNNEFRYRYKNMFDLWIKDN